MIVDVKGLDAPLSVQDKESNALAAVIDAEH
jgi:hypothetical protein